MPVTYFLKATSENETNTLREGDHSDPSSPSEREVYKPYKHDATASSRNTLDRLNNESYYGDQMMVLITK